jgi:hypothetical protein
MMASEPASSATHACSLLIPASTFSSAGLRRNNFGIFSELLRDFNAGLQQVLRRKRRIAHHRLPDKVTLPQFAGDTRHFARFARFARGV